MCILSFITHQLEYSLKQASLDILGQALLVYALHIWPWVRGHGGY